VLGIGGFSPRDFGLVLALSVFISLARKASPVSGIYAVGFGILSEL